MCKMSIVEMLKSEERTTKGKTEELIELVGNLFSGEEDNGNEIASCDVIRIEKGLKGRMAFNPAEKLNDVEKEDYHELVNGEHIVVKIKFKRKKSDGSWWASDLIPINDEDKEKLEDIYS